MIKLPTKYVDWIRILILLTWHANVSLVIASILISLDFSDVRYSKMILEHGKRHWKCFEKQEKKVPNLKNKAKH